MELKDYRMEMDEIDDQLIDLFRRRMEQSGRIAAYKKETGLPVLDAGREREKVKELTERMPPEMRNYTGVLYSSLFELSRSYQNRQLLRRADLNHRIDEAIAQTGPLFPRNVTVAVWGVEGDFAQIASERLFQMPCILYFNNLEGVFNAVRQGLCRYAVVPIESSVGSMKRVYDLIARHNFSIVRSLRMKMDYSLLSRSAAGISQIKELYADEAAMGQCAGFLKSMHPDVKRTVCESTAMAAKLVAQSHRDDVAAICSRDCADIYGLNCLQSGIQDPEAGEARFVCVSKDLEIYPGADRTTLLLSASNKPGALYKILARFYALGINITKLESCPIPGRDSQIMFCFDLETSIYSQEFVQMICELSASCEEFVYLGSYSEVV